MRYFYLIFLLMTVTVVGMAGFRGSHSRQPQIEFFNDMVRQNKVRPQTPSEFFGDERSSRVRPEGTVERSKPYEINGEVLKINGLPVYPYEDGPVNTGRLTGTTNFIAVNPLPITRQFLDRGGERFQIYCAPCHGPDGDGKGITAKYGMAGMANFHDERLVKMGDGEIFSTLSGGLRLMPAYGAIIPVEDRWAIISYIRVLQRSQLAIIEDVPEQNRPDLKVKK
jgi:hypothetical protein